MDLNNLAGSLFGGGQQQNNNNYGQGYNQGYDNQGYPQNGGYPHKDKATLKMVATLHKDKDINNKDKITKTMIMVLFNQWGKVNIHLKQKMSFIVKFLVVE